MYNCNCWSFMSQKVYLKNIPWKCTVIAINPNCETWFNIYNHKNTILFCLIVMNINNAIKVLALITLIGLLVKPVARGRNQTVSNQAEVHHR